MTLVPIKIVPGSGKIKSAIFGRLSIDYRCCLMTHSNVPQSMTERLNRLHDRLLGSIPSVDRIGCAIYDPKEDTLKTFINSTRKGHAISAYEYKLSDSKSLSELARTGMMRVVDNLQEVFKPTSEHTTWLLDQGYHSSFTVPLYDQDQFLGFVFFDSVQQGAFTPQLQRDLVLFANLINLTLAQEFASIRSVNASVAMARDFAHQRDFETGAHLDRMARTSRIIAKAVSRKFGLSDEFIEHLFLFAPLHDIGKIGIPDNILLKNGRLTPVEREVMDTHVTKGVEIAQNILRNFRMTDVADSSVLINLIAHHHEYLDGSGYPAGLKNGEIPVEARIVAVADILDALVSHRPYKEKWTFDDALAELKKMAALGKLDSDCVSGVETHRDEILQVVEKYQDLHPDASA